LLALAAFVIIEARAFVDTESAQNACPHPLDRLAPTL
jgi:hypothetical protein